MIGFSKDQPLMCPKKHHKIPTYLWLKAEIWEDAENIDVEIANIS